MNLFNRISVDIKIYILFYFLSFILILFNFNFIYFDDWTLVNQEKKELINIFTETGNSFFGYFHYIILKYFGIYFYKVFVFISYFISGILLNEVLKKIIFLTFEERVFLVIIFLILPVNFARIALIDSPYAFSYLLFFVSFFFFSKYLNDRKIIYRFLSLLIFFISFQVNSFLVFYIIVFIYALYILYDKNVKIWIIKSFKLIDFWTLPFIFYIFKSIYLIPQGLHLSYYEINLEKVVNAFIGTVYIFKRFYNELFILISQYSSFEMIVINSIIIFFLIKKFDLIFFDTKNQFFSKKKVLILFFLGIFLSYISMYPYMVVNTSPSFFGWDSRHMLLLSFGVSVFFLSIYYMINLNKHIKVFVFIILISVFININNSIYYRYIVDGIKQDAILFHMKKNSLLEKYNSFIIYDELKNYNNLNRSYRFYEYGGMLDQIFGNQNKFARLSDQDIGESTLLKYITSSLKLKNYKIDNNFRKVYISKGDMDMTFVNVVKCIYYKIFFKEKYDFILQKILLLKVI